jgi:hypothetical protein
MCHGWVAGIMRRVDVDRSVPDRKEPSMSRAASYGLRPSAGFIVTTFLTVADVERSAPQNPNEVSSFMNIRVADIRSCYDTWRARGANKEAVS